MLRVLDCITNEHDLRFVVVAGLICLFACYTALGMIARASGTDSHLRFKWIVGAALVTGCGVWATHFVDMLAYRPNLPIGYDVALTFASVLIAIALSFIGFTLVATGKRFVAIGGAIIGLGIGAMHYVGMAAVRIPANVHYHAGFIAASVVLGVAFAVPAALLAARRTDLRSRVIGTLLLTIAIFSLHFTAMASATLLPGSAAPLPEFIIDPEWLAFGVAAITVFIIALGLGGTVIDDYWLQRATRESERLRAYVMELETTKHRLEETTAALRTSLEAAAASSHARSQFLATMSHELRTPLNAVIGFSDILANERFGPIGIARYREYAQDIKKSGEHLLALINDVLDLTKLDMGRLELNEEIFSLAVVAKDVVRMISTHATGAGIELHTDIAEDLPPLNCDVLRIRQVLINLLSNAVKFTPSGGAVEIVAGRSDSGIEIKISDTGIGIAAEDIPKALERFGQVDNKLERRYEGSGLGLPIAKRLIELHGGSLGITSVVGQGTTVAVVIPARRIATGKQVSRAA